MISLKGSNVKTYFKIFLILLIWLVLRGTELNAKKGLTHDGAIAAYAATGNWRNCDSFFTNSFSSEPRYVNDWQTDLFGIKNNSIKDVYRFQKTSDIHPPLYHYLLFFWFKVFGYSVVNGMLLNLLFELILIGLFVLVLKRLNFSNNLVFLGILVLIVNPASVAATSVLRPYVLLNLFFVLLVLWFVAYVKKDKLRYINILQLGITLGLGSLCHYQFIVFALCFAIIVFAKRKTRSIIFEFLPAMAIGALVCELFYPGYFHLFFNQTLRVGAVERTKEYSTIINYFTYLILPKYIIKVLGNKLVLLITAIVYGAVTFLILKLKLRFETKGLLLFYALFLVIGPILFWLELYRPHVMVLHRYFYVLLVLVVTVFMVLSKSYKLIGLLVVPYLIINAEAFWLRVKYKEKSLDPAKQIVLVDANRGEFGSLVSSIEKSSKLQLVKDVSELGLIKQFKGQNLRLIFAKRSQQKHSNRINQFSKKYEFYENSTGIIFDLEL
ncbi:MAG: glycosyltransferase family 39 protein [Bacteroidia bacterium]